MWVDNLCGEADYTVSEHETLWLVDLGLSVEAYSNDGNINFPPDADADLGNRIVFLKIDRLKEKYSTINEIVDVPEIKIRCKKDGFYALVIEEMHEDNTVGYSTKRFFNGVEIQPTYNQLLYNRPLNPKQFVYHMWFEKGDIFSIKHYGGKLSGDYSSYTWDDDQILIFNDNTSKKTLSHRIGVVAWYYQLTSDTDGRIVYTPINASSNFEAVAE